MTLRVHLPHRTPDRSAPPRQQPSLGSRVFVVQRIGAVLVALFLVVFGVLGLLDGLPFFSTGGNRVLGLSSNGLLSVISLVTAGVLVPPAVLPRPAGHLDGDDRRRLAVPALVLATSPSCGPTWNVLAFRFSNVVFSAGRRADAAAARHLRPGPAATSRPTARTPAPDDDDTPPPVVESPSTPEEYAAERAMRDAEVAVVQHTADADQRRRVEAMSRVSAPAPTAAFWMSFDSGVGRERRHVSLAAAMPSPAASTRTRDRADACPGALQTHAAATVRWRGCACPGGLLSPPTSCGCSPPRPATSATAPSS